MNIATNNITIQNEIFTLTNQRALFWGKEKALIFSDLHIGKTAHFRKKTDESLNIRRSETTCGHPRIINPPSTKFFEKK